ncbi:ribonuclease Z [Methanoculleus bourgensis]|uniref:Ribonuclease Z n=1 Tax=Methanoculleus bourgensis TaxID=83986 RepID=A0A0X3BMK7_9EURY|nr:MULTISPECIES: ribonuclease Z [Methanoculleus]MBT0733295.1 ribonuclease Z [Methanoculleus bourgensis]MDD3372161.1 ribonuclease Z [Methanoculleus bourgensis]NMA88296.1 ribonuclease Z [Methanoculleus bourgensis]NQS77804.1 ribonuclease Z [Methanoculleus bourgensis]CVK32844.1 Ribonuclease Z [Methanoculleus bourgensis]
MVRIAGETLHVHFLGTAGALPSPQRNPPSILIRRGSDTLLFDCGEGTQQQMMRARTGFTVNAIFITHWHADHFLGVFGLVETLAFMGRTDPLPIYGPPWVGEFVDLVQRISRHVRGFPITGHALEHGSVVPFDGYTVRAFATFHGIPGLGYVLEEDERPGRFNREQAIALGIPPGPLFGRLQRGEAIRIVRDGVETEVRPSDVMGEPRPGRKIVYTGDTRPLQRLPDAAGMVQDADLLIHDATFDDEEADRAREVLHSTAGEAGEAAAASGARMLALVHISSRYTSTANHIRDAKRRYEGDVILPADLTVLEVPFRS